MVTYCALFGCLSSSRNNKDRCFFRFPKNEKRCKKWLQAAGRQELSSKSVETLHKNYFLCDLHFLPTDRHVKKLKSFAVPSLKLPHHEIGNPTKSTQTVHITAQNSLTNETSSQTDYFITLTVESFTQTDTNLPTDTPPKWEILSDIKTDTKKHKILENWQECTSVFQTDANISPQLQKLIELHTKLKPNSLGNRYDRDFKIFALNIYLASPMAYRILAKTLSLPDETTLRRVNINIGTKLSSHVLKCLEVKLKNLKESEKYCIICADEISLKRHLYYKINEDRIIGFHEIDGTQTAEPGTHAFVIMARGIFSNWNQPLAYCYLAESKNYRELSMWLDDIISKILSIGFLVVAFVSNQGPIFLNMTKDRNVTVDKPYFFIGGKKIYYIFDVPHLIKSVRNNLMSYDFEFSDGDGTKVTAKWEDVKTFYRQDCDRTYRLAPKLTESHINPNHYEKNKLKYATQIFSNTVAAAINCSIECGRLEKGCSGTVELIGLIDKTFDVLNSSSTFNTNAYKIAFAAKSHQTEILDKFDSFLSDVTVLNSHKKNVTNTITCLEGLKITLKSIKNLSQDLQSDGFSFLLTRRLNKDPLDNFFGAVRQQGGNCRDPTPIQFSRAFRKFFMVHLLKYSEHTNCTDDLDHLVINADEIGRVSLFSSHEEIPTDSLTVAVGTVDYRFDLPEKNAFVYVCGYLLKKCFDIHRCEGINQYVKKKSQAQDDNFHQNTLLLISPPNSFVSCIKAMDDQFKLFFQDKIFGSVGQEILKKISDICINDCCLCFPNIYLKKLFVRFRIFNTIKLNNRLFRNRSFERKYFSINNI